jgi:RNA polymerase sigma-70 factor (ECF subfamily)
MGARTLADIDALLADGAFDRAATRMLEEHGPELYGFLASVLGSDSDADEVFAQVGEDLWRGLPRFSRRCSPRTWLYALARNAAANYRRSPWRRAGQLVGDSAFDGVVARVRTTTAPWLRTDVKDRWRELRASLTEDDRSLLSLRIDRQFSWEDIARITLGVDVADQAALDRETGRLRKRFQLLKDDLREKARAAGLVDGHRS